MQTEKKISMCTVRKFVVTLFGDGGYNYEIYSCSHTIHLNTPKQNIYDNFDSFNVSEWAGMSSF